MSYNMEGLNLLIANKLGEFVRGRLLQNKAHLDNSGDFVSVDEAYTTLSLLRSKNVTDYPIEYTSEYRTLADRCTGRINFTEEEIDEIAELVEKSVSLFGLGHNVTYWDVLSFVNKRLDRLASERVNKLGANAYMDEDYSKAMKYKSCLQLEKTPLYYKPFACIVACGYPYSALRIANDNNETIYDISNNGEVRVDDLLSDMFLEEGFSNRPNDSEDSQEAISVAVDWWAKAITDPTFVIRYDRNASYLSSMLALINVKNKKAPEEKVIEAFKGYLAEEIRSGLEQDGHFSISVNYALDPALNNACTRANLFDNDYTWDTTMEISPSEVTISFGRSEKQVIYSGKNKDGEKSYQKVMK